MTREHRHQLDLSEKSLELVQEMEKRVVITLNDAGGGTGQSMGLLGFSHEDVLFENKMSFQCTLKWELSFVKQCVILMLENSFLMLNENLMLNCFALTQNFDT